MSDKEEPEEIEGLDENISDGWGDYPLDAVFVRTESRTVAEVVKRIENNRYILDPDFQRDFVWKEDKQSKLIESCVMRIPLPVFYVAEAPDGRIIVVDGLQRLTTFSRYMDNKFKLKDLTKDQSRIGSHELEGKYFRDLPIRLQERISDTQLTMYILDSKAPERAKLDIFERVNSGEILTRQQMRNALYTGPATAWLRQAAANKVFKQATGNSLNTKTMRDREAINRFCAFKLLGYQNYANSDMDDFLAKGLRELGKISDEQREKLFDGFIQSMALNCELFGKHAFRKSLASNYQHDQRTVINISLFEICAVSLFNLKPENKKDKQKIKKAIIDLFDKNIFLEAISYSTNSSRPVKTRFNLMLETIKNLEINQLGD